MTRPSTMLLFFIISILFTTPANAKAQQRRQISDPDPWRQIRHIFLPGKTPGTPASQPKECRESDPWAAIRSIFLPLSIRSEPPAPDISSRKIRLYLSQRLYPFRRYIQEAARTFQIPPSLIKAVIMVESGGNPAAKAQKTSAGGLMQTIAPTFEAARRALATAGIFIDSSPFEPRSSIMAGSWYLKQMYSTARRDSVYNVPPADESRIWSRALKYYYAGPANIRSHREIRIVYNDGTTLIINPQAYSDKVMSWAQILRQTPNSNQG